jgi:glutamate carboxypeptidase
MSLDYFTERSDAIVRLIQQLVEIESPSGDTHGDLNVLTWLVDRVSKIPAITTIERVPAEKFGEHIVLRAFEDVEGEKPVLLLGHTDTVHPKGTKSENPTRIENGMLYGCGVFDMKASVVLMLEVVRAIAESGETPKRPVNILLTCDEEVGSPTGREIVEAEGAKAGFVLISEPSLDGKAKTGRKGTGGYTVAVKGIPAHAGLEPERGSSAILELARQIEKIHSLADESKGTTVNVCMIGGGTATNVIPENAECSVDVRFTTLEEAERVDRELKTLAPSDDRNRITVEGAINRPPMERSDNVVALFEKARRISSELGYELEETQVGGASDGNFIAALGIPVLDGLGIKGDGAHTLGERIQIDEIPFRAELLRRLIQS